MYILQGKEYFIQGAIKRNMTVESIPGSKPDMVQMFDMYIDRQYYKVNPGFFGTYKSIVRVDRIKEWRKLVIDCKELPDEIIVNGEECKLVRII